MRMLWKWNDIRTTLWFRCRFFFFENCVDMDFGSVTHSKLVSILWNFSVQQIPLKPAKPCTCLDEVPANDRTIFLPSTLNQKFASIHSFHSSTGSASLRPIEKAGFQSRDKCPEFFDSDLCRQKSIARISDRIKVAPMEVSEIGFLWEIFMHHTSSKLKQVSNESSLVQGRLLVSFDFLFCRSQTRILITFSR